MKNYLILEIGKNNEEVAFNSLKLVISNIKQILIVFNCKN